MFYKCKYDTVLVKWYLNLNNLFYYVASLEPLVDLSDFSTLLSPRIMKDKIFMRCWFSFYWLKKKKSLVIFMYYMNHKMQRQGSPIGYLVHCLTPSKWFSTINFSSALCNLVLNISADNRILTASLGKLLNTFSKLIIFYFIFSVYRQVDGYRYILKDSNLIFSGLGREEKF